MLTKKNALILFVVALFSGFILGRTTAPGAAQRVTAGESVKVDTAHQESSSSFKAKR